MGSTADGTADGTAGDTSGSAAGAPAGELPAARRLQRMPYVIWLGLGALLLSFAHFHATWLQGPGDTWAGNLGDPEQAQFFLAWPPFAIGHGLNPFVTHYILYPAGANLMWNTSTMLPSILVAPVTVLLGPTVAYDTLLLLAPAAAAMTAFLAFRRWTGRAGATVGALLFAFCPFVFAHAVGHIHLVLVALIPVLLLLVDELAVRQRWPWWAAGVALGAAAAGQLLTAEELLALAVVIAAIGVVVLAALHPRAIRAKLPYAAKAAGAALGSFAVLAAYPLWVQFGGPYRVTAPIHDGSVYVNDLLNAVVPVNEWLGGGAGTAVAAGWSGNASEWNGYLGVPLLALVLVVVVWQWRRPVVRFATVLMVAAEVLSFGAEAHLDGVHTGVPLPWTVFRHLPMMHQAISGRFGLFADLFAALLVAVAVDAVGAARRRALVAVGRARLRAVTVMGVVLVLVGGVAVSWVPRPPGITTVAQPAYFSSTMPEVPSGSVAVVLPLVYDPASEHAQLWQARAGFPYKTPEGWAIIPGPHYGPTTFTYLVWSELAQGHQPPQQNLSWMLLEWRAWHVQTVIVGPWDGHQQQAVDLLRRLLDVSPRWYGDTAVFTGYRLG